MTLSFEDAWLNDIPRLVPLSEVVIQALSAEAYTAATSAAPAFETWLSTLGTLKQGDIYSAIFLPGTATFTASDEDTHVRRLKYLVKATGPTLNGIALKSITNIYVTPIDRDASVVERNLIAATTEACTYEIDEDFLEKGLLFTLDCRNSQTFSLATLTSPIKQIEDEHTIYIHTKDLGRLGILNGDWVIIRSDTQFSSRLARVQVNELMSCQENSLCASPILCRNIIRDAPGVRINLYPTPFGSNRPAIPTARAVTIARISSPISVDKSYQELFLQSLHEHFHRCSRIMQKDDIIAVALDSDDTRWTTHSDDLQYPSASTDNINGDYHRSSASISLNEIAYFMVTNIEYDALPADVSPSDLYSGIATGEWGCWVDSSITRIVQTGVEHARVPDVARYLGIDVIPFLRTALSDKLADLVSAALTPNAFQYHLQLTIIAKGARGVGKMTTIQHVAQQLGLHVLELNCYEVVDESDAQTEGFLRARFEKATLCSPCIFVLRHVEALSQTTQSSDVGKALTLADVLSECIEMLQQSWTLTGYPVIVIATTDRPDETHTGITACFKHELSFDAPEEGERQSILQALTDNIALASDVSLKDFSVQTAALVASDMVDLVSRGKHAYMNRAMRNSGCDAVSLYRAGTVLGAGDLEVALNKARASYSESIGAPKIPSVSWDDVGGLANVKADILDTIQLPLEHPELFSQGLKKRSGILLYGPPGTGKTLLAKAVATSCSLNFFSVKGPELLNMYIGESEANVRRVFQRARDAKPCVIFFDELDSVAPKRGAHGDSGGVMDRIVSQLLAELDGVAAGEAGADVFVIGATNRPDLLDPALLRPGRFDRMLYLGVSQTHEAQLNILQALTRKFKLHPDLSLKRIAEACPFHYTGADLYALCSDALLKAMSRKAEDLEARIAVLNAGPIDSRHPHPIMPQYYLAEMASAEDIEVLVSQEDFESALRSLIPSVSQAEMEHYARVQQQFSKETINRAT